MSNPYQTDIPVMTETEESGQFYEGPEIPVRIMSSEAEATIPVAPEFCSMNEFNPIAQVNVTLQPTQICPRRKTRYKASFVFRTGSSGAVDVWVNTNINALMGPNPQGFYVHMPASSNNQEPLPDYYCQQPLYVVSSQPDTILSVMDMSYGDAGHSRGRET